MNLAIDIGNSRIKWARFNKHEVIESGMTPEADFEALKALMDFHRNDAFTLSSVVTLDKDFKDYCERADVLLVNHKTQCPVKSQYTTPKTLGMDRLCAAIGAKSLFPKDPVLAIDIGTCVKYEFVTKKGEYVGGNISPGLQMRFTSLNQHTSKLPKLKPKKISGPLGRSTEQALRLGVQQGMLFEIQAMIQTMKTLHPDLKTVGTGGDLPFFVNDLKTHIFADLLLVLRGINEIYLYNS
ncbi:MAG: type III pantothenate kinase [Flavobacteriales bacterium]|jgi:type III pantothenate kinase|nr:type III pantothenate kinase [Flavobacteriales bacterium]